VVKSRVRKNPQWVDGYVALGRVQAAAGWLSDGEQSLQKALALNPKDGYALLALGDLYLSENKPDQALASYTKLADLAPRSALAYTRIGQVEDILQRWDPAQRAYKKVLELDSNNVLAQNNLAWDYAEHGGDIDVALRLAQDAKQAQPDNPAISDTLGWIYLKKQILGNAIELLKQSVNKNPKNPEYNYHLGMAYFQAGRTQDARNSLDATLRLQPNFPQAQEVRKMLASLKN